MAARAIETGRPWVARALVLALAVALACSAAPHPGVEQREAAAVVPPRVATVASPIREVAGAAWRRRYPVATALDKLVTNRGDGLELLYGTRNVRAVLNGVYYRGGANNAFHRTTKRNNSNPLPDDGLANLCREGFRTVLYLYPTRFDTAPPSESCRTFDGDDGHLDYGQISVLRGRRADIQRILATVLQHIRKPELGPIYVHCWNGWHASGYAAAATLRQFCGFDAKQAVHYWDVNTDGANGGGYGKVRELIRTFEPFPELTIGADERAALCPDPATFAFRPQT